MNNLLNWWGKSIIHPAERCGDKHWRKYEEQDDSRLCPLERDRDGGDRRDPHPDGGDGRIFEYRRRDPPLRRCGIRTCGGISRGRDRERSRRPDLGICPLDAPHLPDQGTRRRPRRGHFPPPEEDQDA